MAPYGGSSSVHPCHIQYRTRLGTAPSGRPKQSKEYPAFFSGGPPFLRVHRICKYTLQPLQAAVAADLDEEEVVPVKWENLYPRRCRHRRGHSSASMQALIDSGVRSPIEPLSIVKLMNDLPYQAEVVLTERDLPGAPPVIEAFNCVCHGVALKYPEVCRFDISLMKELTRTAPIHEKCIIRGDGICRFRLK